MFYLNSIGWIPNSAIELFTMGRLLLDSRRGGSHGALLQVVRLRHGARVIQSMLLITVTFLVLRGQVNEQYALYLYALVLIDVALWSPQRRRLLFASIAAVLLYHVTNDLLLIRYVAPVYPHVLTIEANLISAINPERNFLLFFSGDGLLAAQRLLLRPPAQGEAPEDADALLVP